MSLFLMYDSEDVVIKSNLEVTYNFSWNGPMYSLKNLQRYIIHCMLVCSHVGLPSSKTGQKTEGKERTLPCRQCSLYNRILTHVSLTHNIIARYLNSSITYICGKYSTGMQVVYSDRFLHSFTCLYMDKRLLQGKSPLAH